MHPDKGAARGGCCDDTHGDSALPLEQALARMLAEVAPVQGNETVALVDSLGRVLDQDVVSTVDVPSHTNAAMDGYALHASALAQDSPVSLAVVGTAWAGRPLEQSVGPGQCARIMTGAVMPRGTDTVVMQEHVQAADGAVTIGPGHRPGQHVRPAGEDIARGAVGLARGARIQPAHMGVLASLGVASVRVRRRPRVAFFSTGDELRPVGELLQEGQVYDSNRYTLRGMLSRLGMELDDLGVVPDEPAALESVLARAARTADAVVTTGGVSVGEADFVTGALERLGQVSFWKVAMKPGRPVAFGRIGQAWFFGLPGNPVSVMATFYQLVQPALEAMTGAAGPDPVITLQAACAHKLKKKPGRREFQRGVLERDPDGGYRVRGTGHQGAGVLSSMAEANCFIVLEEDRGTVEAGEPVTVQPFRALV